MQDKIENILRENPRMKTAQLIRAYLIQYTHYDQYQRDLFMEMLKEAYVPSITRHAAKCRQNMKVRDDVRDDMAEQERRYWPEQKALEANPPSINEPITLF